MRITRLLVLSLTLLATAASASSALAQSDSEARGLFLAGQAAFEQARYEDALNYFRRAHELSGRPELLYNVGIAADRLRRDEEALEAFEGFLAQTPETAPQRRDVEARVVVLRASVERLRATQAAQTAETTQTAETGTDTGTETTESSESSSNATSDSASSPGATSSSGGGDTVGAWVLIGTGAAAAVAGAIVLGIGRADAAALESPSGDPVWGPEQNDAVGRVDAMTIAGIVVMSVGVAAAIGGVIWLVATPSGGGSTSERAATSRARARLGVGLSGLRLQGEF